MKNLVIILLILSFCACELVDQNEFDAASGDFGPSDFSTDLNHSLTLKIEYHEFEPLDLSSLVKK
jgi:hypothetical protein